MSIRFKINLALMTIGLITSLFVAAFNYYEARNQIYTSAYEKAELISSYAVASREYAKNTMRPLALELANQQSFHPELMAGFFVTRAIADIFSQEQKGYSFKQATVNPIHPKSKSNQQETDIISFFNQNKDVKLKKGTLLKGDEEFFYVARPVVNKEPCLKCHGTRNDRPKAMLVKYQGTGGYGWKVGDVVATLITYVPIEQALAELKITAIKTVLVGFGSIALIMLSISFLMNRLVVKPITELTELADNLSRGKGLDRKIEKSSNDEIGALCESFNRMRASVVKLIEMVKTKKT